jgi:hypothetical protein
MNQRTETGWKSVPIGPPDDFINGTINLKFGTAAKCRALKVAAVDPRSR